MRVWWRNASNRPLNPAQSLQLMLEIQQLPLLSVSADRVTASSPAFAVLSVALVGLSSRCGSFWFLIQMSPGPPLLGHGGDIVVKNTHRVLCMPHLLQPCLTGAGAAALLTLRLAWRRSYYSTNIHCCCEPKFFFLVLKLVTIYFLIWLWVVFNFVWWERGNLFETCSNKREDPMICWFRINQSIYIYIYIYLSSYIYII